MTPRVLDFIAEHDPLWERLSKILDAVDNAPVFPQSAKGRADRDRYLQHIGDEIESLVWRARDEEESRE